MKKIFIDLGSHMFEGLNRLLSDKLIDQSFCVYAYEANPNIFKKLDIYKNNFSFFNFNCYNEAVCKFDGETIFNLDDSNISQGCNILAHPPAEDILWKTKYNWKQIIIPCVSIKTVLSRCNLENNDIVIIKCDIEGSEFEVLECLLETTYLNNISKIFVEWHDRFWYPNHYLKEKEKQNLIEKFKQNNIILENWE